MPPRILLLGGIGSGKTTVSRMLAQRGAILISTDDLARSVLAPGTEATAAVLAMWPSTGVDGVIDRSRLGRRVFADPAELAALEAITHPATRLLVLEEIEHHPDDTVVVEMPLLRDGWGDDWLRIVVDVPEEIRIARVLVRDPVLTEPDVRAIMQRQPARGDLLLAADYVVDNSGDLESLDGQCTELWSLIHDS